MEFEWKTVSVILKTRKNLSEIDLSLLSPVRTESRWASSPFLNLFLKDTKHMGRFNGKKQPEVNRQRQRKVHWMLLYYLWCGATGSERGIRNLSERWYLKKLTMLICEYRVLVSYWCWKEYIYISIISLNCLKSFHFNVMKNKCILIQTNIKLKNRVTQFFHAQGLLTYIFLKKIAILTVKLRRNWHTFYWQILIPSYLRD